MAYEPINPLTTSMVALQHTMPGCVAAIKKISFPVVRDLSERAVVLCGVTSGGSLLWGAERSGRSIEDSQWSCGVDPPTPEPNGQTLQKIPGVNPAA